MEIWPHEHKTADSSIFGEVQWHTETHNNFITTRDDGTFFAQRVNRASGAYLEELTERDLPQKIKGLDAFVLRAAARRGVEDFSPRQEIKDGKTVTEVRTIPVPLEKYLLRQISPSTIGVLGRVAGLHGGEFGILLRIKRPSSSKTEDIFIPAAKLTSKAKLKDALGEWGINILPSRSTRDTRETDFLSWLIDSNSPRLIYNMGRIGHAFGPANQPVFALPEKVIGMEQGAKVLRSDPEALLPPVQSAGTLQGWHDALHELRSLPNSKGRFERHELSLFFVMASLAAPLLRFLSVEAGGFHAYGESSKGKTLAARAGASVWGPVYHARGADDLFYQKWYSSKNGLEGVASMYNDIPLILDESKEADDEDVADACYILAHGVGKSTMTKTRELRKAKKWQTLLLSTGEQSIDETIRRSKRDEMVGQRVRMVDIQCTGDGITATLEEDRLRQFGSKVRQNYGHAGVLFVQRLMNQRPEDLVEKFNELSQIRSVGLKANTEKRVAKRFALVQLAGNLAQEWGILPSWFHPAHTIHLLHSQFNQDLSATNLSETEIAAKLLLDYVDARIGRDIIEVQEKIKPGSSIEYHEQQSPKLTRVGWLVVKEKGEPSLWLPLPGLKKILNGRPHLPFVRAMKNEKVLLPPKKDGKNLTKRRPYFRPADAGQYDGDLREDDSTEKFKRSTFYAYEFNLQLMSEFANR